jgi:hypothetical protein
VKLKRFDRNFRLIGRATKRDGDVQITGIENQKVVISGKVSFWSLLKFSIENVLETSVEKFRYPAGKDKKVFKKFSRVSRGKKTCLWHEQLQVTRLRNHRTVVFSGHFFL